MYNIAFEYKIYTRSGCLISNSVINTMSESLDSVKEMVLGLYDNSYSIKIKNLIQNPIKNETFD